MMPRFLVSRGNPILAQTLFKLYLRFREVIIFGLVGIVTNLSFLLLFVILTRLDTLPQTAATICYIGALLCGYVLNRSLSFRDEAPLKQTIGKYIALYAIGYVLVMAMHHYLPVFGLSSGGIQVLAIFIVTAFNFLVMKFLIFTGHDHA